MAVAASPFQTTLPESWIWTIHQFERGLARPHGGRLRPLLDLTRQIAVTAYGQSYRAGTHLRETLVISTATDYGLAHDEAHIIVSIKRRESDTPGFGILYYGGEAWHEDVQALVKTYATHDDGVIWKNLRRDLPDHYYPCDFSEVWETLQPLMVRLWNETRPTP